MSTKTIPIRSTWRRLPKKQTERREESATGGGEARGLVLISGSLVEAYQVEIENNEGDLNFNLNLTSFRDSSCTECQLFRIADDAGSSTSCTLQPHVPC